MLMPKFTAYDIGRQCVNKMVILHGWTVDTA